MSLIVWSIGLLFPNVAYSEIQKLLCSVLVVLSLLGGLDTKIVMLSTGSFVITRRQG